MNQKAAHILLVDDDKDILKMLSTMLGIKNYRVTTTDRPLELEKLILTSDPDLLMMDMLMSGCDGRVICHKLKSTKEFVHLPILMLSAHPTAKEECLSAGADDFIEKPFEMPHLFEVISRLLG